MSMISEQIHYLRSLAADQTPEALYEVFDALNEAADTIEFLSTKLRAANMERSAEDCGGWITDREPRESGYYLVTHHEWSNGNYLPKFDDTYVKRLHYQESEQFTGWNYPKCVDKKAEEDMNMEVLAWQPLPEPYHEPRQIHHPQQRTPQAIPGRKNHRPHLPESW